MRFLPLALAAALLAFAVYAALRPDPVVAAVDEVRRANAIAGAVVAFGDPSGPPTLVTLGEADPRRGIAMAPDARFRIASLTKPIAAAAALRAARDGALDLDAPLPGLPVPFDPRAAAITPRMLMAHRGGLGAEGFDPMFEPARLGLPEDTPCDATALHLWSTAPLLHAPDTEKAYSNVGMCLLAVATEGATGLSLSDLLAREAEVTLGGPATPLWARTDAGWEERLDFPEAFRRLGAAGGGTADAAALWSFAARPHPVQAQSWEGEDRYAQGWRVWPGPDGAALTHWGGISTDLFTLMVVLPDGEPVVALFNGGVEDLDGTFRTLFAAICSAREQTCG
ncbi:serine hydrolase domain-containing protein [Jannaschia aquimarina]|uniref:EstB_1 protein n=1 Tax=Jannaschia aquimarina TaxID=935700 RepID=A0A0D1DB88_9RHOB|nr:serine hydrolase domain-containing protein [Jannaschia aquimarina]KIT17218.1 Esterase EstB [Jannaschia aquimarina]SNT18609.1 Beta-lactamase [Jannaschia aquimarina]